jgi:hypothetical protein
MIKFLLPFFLLLSACATATGKVVRHNEYRFVEPPRSQLMGECMSQGMPITFCLCIEEVITRDTVQLDDVTNEQFGAAQQKCMKEIGPMLQKEIQREVLRQTKKIAI